MVGSKRRFSTLTNFKHQASIMSGGETKKITIDWNTTTVENIIAEAVDEYQQNNKADLILRNSSLPLSCFFSDNMKSVEACTIRNKNEDKIYYELADYYKYKKYTTTQVSVYLLSTLNENITAGNIK